MLLNYSSSSSTRNQYITTLIINLVSLAHGSTTGWVSSAILHLKSEDTHFKQPITLEQVSWIGASLPIGAFCGTFLFGYLAEVLGKKTSLILVGFPNMIFWFLVYFSTDVWHLYLARGLAGFSTGGIFAVVSQFIADISENHIRGAFGSVLVLAVNLGILLGYIAGAYLSFFTIPLVMLAFPCLYVILFVVLLPDTPNSLLKHNKVKEAKESLMFYRSCKSNGEDYPEKINIEFEVLLKSFETPIDQEESQKLHLSDFKSKIAIRGLLVGAFLMALSQFCGAFSVMTYTSTIFEASGSSFNPNVSTIFVGVTQLLGSLASTLFVEKFGRKILLVLSSIGTGLGLGILAIYSYLDKQGVEVRSYGWIPIFSLSFVVFAASVGVMSLPFIVLTELLPNKIRSISSPFCTSFVPISAFITLLFFPTLMQSIELYGCMLVFSVICWGSAVIILIFLPETKGKNLLNKE